MLTYVRADPTKFDKFLEEIMSNVFQEKLRNAVAHPESKDAKYFFNKFLLGDFKVLDFCRIIVVCI